ncbi:hypothetical protein HJG60_010248 [Phyllostomus discolor]|uniref:Uncharacterized protein n=1 Tax=Phyllostomus discolor TaxID=89673 RepID=A0A834AWM0_9CHIR|nr:hypothetical protein HJG60_010248 [Phyllostomus discolor]
MDFSFGLSPNFFRVLQQWNVTLSSLGLEKKLLPPFDVRELSSPFRALGCQGRRGRGNRGGGLEAGLASHGGRAEPVVEPVVELVCSVRTSESAGRQYEKDWISSWCRVELTPASPPPSAP